MSGGLVVVEPTALATVVQETCLTLGDPDEMTNEELADIAIEGVKKIRYYLPYITALKGRFDTGDRDSTNRLRIPIKDCSSWKEFCKKHLDRTPEAVRKALRPSPKPESISRSASEVTQEEIAEYESASHKDVRQIASNMLNQGMPAADAVGALIGMNVPDQIAEATVRIVAGPPPSLEAPTGTPKSLQDIRLELCSRTDPRYAAIRDDHYIENHGCIGQQAHFLIHYKGELAGIISGASPVFATSSRDQFFGLTKNNRYEFLQGIVNNTVFRLENHEPNLATRVLCLWRNFIPHFWYEKYGSVVYGFETFVIENDTRKGTLYKADNWTLAGTTAGATKVRNGIENPADDWKEVTPKLVYCRWRDGFNAPCAARTPDWVRKILAEVKPELETGYAEPFTVRFDGRGSHRSLKPRLGGSEPDEASIRTTLENIAS